MKHQETGRPRISFRVKAKSINKCTYTGIVKRPCSTELELLAKPLITYASKFVVVVVVVVLN